MRIGLDLDGLLDEQTAFFRFLTAALRSQGHFVAILTYRDAESRDRTEATLAEWGINYDELHFARSLDDSLSSSSVRGGAGSSSATPMWIRSMSGCCRWACDPRTRPATRHGVSASFI